MFEDSTIDDFIGAMILERNKEEKAKHVSSGKLSASMLGQPLQWQILKIIGVPAKEIDEYTLRKMWRGSTLEDLFIEKNLIPGLKLTQKEVEYRNCVGRIDGIVDSCEYKFSCGVIPHEIKTVSNMKFKHIVKEKKADTSHALQACLYALAEGTEHFAIDYFATDDLRVKTFVYETKKMAGAVNQVIDEFEATIRAGVLPEFVAKEKWQAMPDYQNYPDWEKLSQVECLQKLKKEFPDALKKLLSYGEPK